MPELPERPDLDQLRRQARELLRAAVAGELPALARIHAVSPQLTLSAAQLALAREYGCRSWPALRSEAERRRLAALAETQPPAGGAEQGPPPAFGDRWSFGGAAAIETLTGMLLPEGLVAGDGRATLYTCLTPFQSALEAVARDRRAGDPSAWRGDNPDREAKRRSPAEILKGMEALAQLGDIAVVDDLGTPYTLRRVGTSGSPGWAQLRFQFLVDPVPGPDARWIDLGGQNGTLTRLPRSARAATRVGEVTPTPGSQAEHSLTVYAQSAIYAWLGGAVESRDKAAQKRCASLLIAAAEIQRTGRLEAVGELQDRLGRLCAVLTGERPADGLPAGWAGMLAAADQADGPWHHLDLGATAPIVDGMKIQVDSLISSPGRWLLPLRSVGRWPVEVVRDANGKLRGKWLSMEISAQDDRGNSYLGRSSFGAGHNGIEESGLTFRPRLDPLARSLRLTVTGPTERVAIDLDLGPAEPS